jgi:glycine oxidase
MHAEIAVIGGGVNGLAVARELAARRGASVAVFDDRKLGTASRAAAGLLGAQLEAAGLPEALRPAVFPMLREGRLLHEFLDLYLRESVGLGTGYRCVGALHVARNEPELEALETRYGWQREYGAEVVRLSARLARRLEPGLSPSIAGGIYLPGEAVVDPTALLRALLRSCDELGVRSVAERVRRVECEGGRIRALQTDGGTYTVDAVVLTVGGWLAGLEGLPRGLAPIEPVLSRTVLLRGGRPPGHTIVSARGYVVPRDDGSLALGASPCGFGRDDDAIAALYATLAILPALSSSRVWHTRVGYRPHSPDGVPWVGRTEVDGLFVATGNVRNGLLLAPTTASNIADLLEGRRCATPLAPPRPSEALRKAPGGPPPL